MDQETTLESFIKTKFGQCAEHNLNIISLNFDQSNQSSINLCSKCFHKKNVNIFKTLNIAQFLESGDNQILQTYPFNVEPSIKKSLQEMKNNPEYYLNEIKQFIENLKQELEEASQILMSKSKSELVQIEESRQRAFDLYSEITDIPLLKNLITNGKEEEIIEFIQKQDQNEGKILELWQAHSSYKKLINRFQKAEPHKILKSLVEQVKNIKFFIEQEEEKEILCSQILKNHHTQEIDFQYIHPISSLFFTENSYNFSQTLSLQNLIGANNLPAPSHSISIMEQVRFESEKHNGLSKGYLDITKKQHLVEIKAMSNEDSQCRLNYPFYRLEKYVIRLDYIQAPNNFIPAFMFGLTSTFDSLFDNTQMSFHEADDKWGISNQIKGTKLHSGYPTMNLRKSYEIRIDLQNNILRVGSLPGYNSVVELKEKNRLQTHEQLFFKIYLAMKEDMVIVRNIFTVYQFDEQM